MQERQDKHRSICLTIPAPAGLSFSSMSLMMWMRPRGLSSSSPRSTKVGQVAVQKPQWTHFQFGLGGLNVRIGQLLRGEQGPHWVFPSIRQEAGDPAGFSMFLGSKAFFIRCCRARKADAGG